MSDFDAFGRKRDESGHEDLGWGTTGDKEANPHVEPVSVSTSASDTGLSTPTEFTTVPTSGSPTPGRSIGFKGFGTILRLVVLAAVAFAIYSAIDAGRDAADSVRDTFNSFNGGGSGGGDRGDDTVPDQVKARKLFTPDGLRDALKIMEREVPGRVTNFSIRRDSINAQVARDGKRFILGFAADAEVPEIFTTVSAGAVGDTLSYEEINPTAPARLMRAANQRLGQSEADVDYFVLSRFGDVLQWGIYYEGGNPIAQGDSRGRYLRRIS